MHFQHMGKYFGKKKYSRTVHYSVYSQTEKLSECLTSFCSCRETVPSCKTCNRNKEQRWMTGHPATAIRIED